MFCIRHTFSSIVEGSSPEVVRRPAPFLKGLKHLKGGVKTFFWLPKEFKTLFFLARRQVSGGRAPGVRRRALVSGGYLFIIVKYYK